MKNIVIAGIPRSGKSQLSRLLMKKLKDFNYTYIEGDNISTSFISLYKNKINPSEVYDADYVKSEKNLEEYFVMNFLKEYSNCTAYYNVLFDTPFLSVESLCKLRDDGFFVVVLGCPRLDVDTFYLRVRKYQDEKDRSYYQDDSMLMTELECYVENCKELVRDCEKNNLKFFDTSFDRDEVLEEVADYIFKNIDL